MIPPHLFYQICLSFLEQNYCTPPKCCELSEYTDSAHPEIWDLSMSRQTDNSGKKRPKYFVEQGIGLIRRWIFYINVNIYEISSVHF